MTVDHYRLNLIAKFRDKGIDRIAGIDIELIPTTELDDYYKRNMLDRWGNVKC